MRLARVAVVVLLETGNWVRARLIHMLFNNVVGIECPRKLKSLGCCLPISAYTVAGSGKLPVSK
jgi:hypothetical protein